MEKGLFSSLFIIVMLVFLSPQLYLLEKNNHILTSKDTLDNLTFSVDQIIVDALVDGTIDNGCAVNSVENYESVIKDYIESFLDDLKKINSLNCTYSNLSSNKLGSVYFGTIKLTCSSGNDLSSIQITKELEFSKKITPSGNCNVKILDQYNSNYLQANITK